MRTNVTKTYEAEVVTASKEGGKRTEVTYVKRFLRLNDAPFTLGASLVGLTVLGLGHKGRVECIFGRIPAKAQIGLLIRRVAPY